MKSEAEIREYRRELKAEARERADVPTMLAGIHNSILTLDWVLGDTPEGDLVRVRAALKAAGLTDAEAKDWVTTVQPGHTATPIQYIAMGSADIIIHFIEQKAG